jgi:simple sugar transport system substrate-binding protein
MKLKIALLSVAMSSAYIFPVQYSQQRNMKLPWLQKSMVSHGLTGWGWRKEAADKLNVNAYQTGQQPRIRLNKLKSLRTLLLKMLMQLSLYQMMQRFWSLY